MEVTSWSLEKKTLTNRQISMRRIRFDLYTQRHDILVAKNGSLQCEKLNNKRKKKKHKESKQEKQPFLLLLDYNI